MREFESFEKEIIEVLIELETKNCLNCISNILQDKKIDFFEKPIKFYLSIQNNDISINTYEDLDNLTPEKLNEFTTYINKKLLICIELFKYLEENNYIVSTNGNFGNPFQLGEVIVNQTNTQLDSFVSSGDKEDNMYYFSIYARKIFYVRDKLKELVKNNYVIESERKYQEQVSLTRKQLNLTLWGLGFTFLALLFSTYFNYKQINKDNSQEVIIKNKELNIRTNDNIYKLSKEQFDELTRTINNIKLKVNTECYYYNEDDNLK